MEESLGKADLVIVAGDAARSITAELASRSSSVTTDDPELAVAALESHSALLATVRSGAPAVDVVEMAQAIPAALPLAFRVDDAACLAPLAASLSGMTDDTSHQQLLALSRVPGMDLIASGIAAALLVRESVGTSTDRDAVVSATMTVADRFSAPSQVEVAGALGALAVHLVFDRHRHAAVQDSPLASSPGPVLRLLESSTWRELTSDSAPRRHAPASDDGVAVRVLPGSYPRFAAPLITLMSDEPRTQVQVTQLSDIDRRLAWLSPNAALVIDRLRVARGLPSRITADALDISGDVVMADWADRGAMWASHHVTDPTRLVVRVHSMDAFSPWLHFIDWGRVDTLVVVSEPFATLCRALLGQRIAHVHLRVIPHSIDPAPYRELPPAQSGGRERTLGMIGWNKQVKDPLWTLEVLSLLRREDPAWKLLLIGPDLDSHAVEYASAVRSRLLGDDIRGAVELTGEVRDIPRVAARCGFIVSASLRESFHLGLFEGVLTGALPVVRNWPTLTPVGGASAVVPHDWVVESPREAARRILAHRDPATLTDAASRSREWARRETDPQRVAEAWRQVVRGSSNSSALPTGTPRA